MLETLIKSAQNLISKPDRESLALVGLCCLKGENKMKELIKYTRHNGKKVVSAREVYDFLQVKSKFSDWIKNRITTYGFIENQDFVTVSKNLENGGREIDYGITIDMAKELGMVERNEKGSEIRKYFIEMEKKAQPDFTPIDSFEAHAVREIQKLNSKEVNTFNYEKGGKKLLLDYNIKNCKYFTGMTPKQIKEKFKNAKFTVAVKKNAKELIRRIDPVTACAMSLTDSMVKMGSDHEKAAAISKQHGKPIFQFMLENGIKPAELSF